MIGELRVETFEPLLDKVFEIDFGGGPVASTLIDVKSLTPPSADHEGRQPWSLLFRADSDELWEQATYPVRHPDLGELSLFLVPIGPDKEGMQYEAVFT